ncbi:hypothetical protein CVT24_006725 [Panaeolus cyanescens]|uniref:Histone H1 n=1 Tax=Panaeolus cyanescens TaxID=181874 RepID=A0A409V9H3_9AGAR|nr:hypothetical protein CVT24_006725 [Panaeolus cyanescens]
MSTAGAAQDVPAIEAIETTPATKTSTKSSRSTTKKAAPAKKAAASSAKPKAETKKATTTKAAATAAAAASARPPWKDIIKECIVFHKDDTRTGVSRSAIKKFAEEKYKVEMNASNLSQLNRAITSGAETGVFALPKGPSGKVKLAPKAKASASKENSKPPSKTAAKPAASKPASKPAATTKKPAAKAPAAKKAAPAPKKVLAGKAKATTTTKKTTAASKRGTAKKAVTGTTPAAKAKTAAKKKAPAASATKKTAAATKKAPAAKPRSKPASKPASKAKKSAQHYPPFPPPNVQLHPEDANNKVFLAIARAFVSVNNRAMTIKDIAERASNYGLVCQSVSAAAQAVTTYIRNHKARCDAQNDIPLLLSHQLSGTPADDDLVAALESRNGGDSHPVEENRATNFRKGTAVWYLSRATGIPCPFTSAGIRLCDYITSDTPPPPPTERHSSRRDKRMSSVYNSDDQSCGGKRKRSLRGCSSKQDESENDRPPKVKLTLRLPPRVFKTQTPTPDTTPEAANDGSSATRPIDVSKDDADMCVDEDDHSTTATLQQPSEPKEEPWSLPPYPRRSISIPCYTPCVDTWYPSYPTPSTNYVDPFRRSPSIATPPPDSDDEFDDFHVSMTRSKHYPDEDELGWDADSEGDGETNWESPGPRSPSAPLIVNSEVTVKEEPTDVQGMLDAWEDFDSSVAESRVADVLAKAAASVLEDQQAVKVESLDPWDWNLPAPDWPDDTVTIKQEDLGATSLLFPTTSLPGPSSPMSPISSHSSQLSSPSRLADYTDNDNINATIRPRSQTHPAPIPFPTASSSTTAQPSPLTARKSFSVLEPSSSVSNDGSGPSAALVTLLKSMSVNSTSPSLSAPSSSSSSPPVSISPPTPCLSPLQTRYVPSSAPNPPERVVVLTCQPCNPAITATQIEDISVYQMKLGAFKLLRRLDTDFVRLNPIIVYSGAPAPDPLSIPNATEVVYGSVEVSGTWVPLSAAQSFVKDHLSEDGARALEVFLSDRLVERFPPALQDFHKSSKSARDLNQFGRPFESTLMHVAQFAEGGGGGSGRGGAGGAGASVWGTPPPPPVVTTSKVGGTPPLIRTNSSSSSSSSTLSDLSQTCAGSATTPFVLGAALAMHDKQAKGENDVPLSATEQEIFHELCVVSDEEGGSGDVDVMMDEGDVEVVVPCPTPSPTESIKTPRKVPPLAPIDTKAGLVIFDDMDMPGSPLSPVPPSPGSESDEEESLPSSPVVAAHSIRPASSKNRVSFGSGASCSSSSTMKSSSSLSSPSSSTHTTPLSAVESDSRAINAKALPLRRSKRVAQQTTPTTTSGGGLQGGSGVASGGAKSGGARPRKGGSRNSLS